MLNCRMSVFGIMKQRWLSSSADDAPLIRFGTSRFGTGVCILLMHNDKVFGKRCNAPTPDRTRDLAPHPFSSEAYFFSLCPHPGSNKKPGFLVRSGMGA